MCNVRLVMSGINNQTNISDLPDLSSFIRAKLNENHTQDQVDLLLDKRRSHKNLMYESVNRAWQADEKTREHFDSRHALFDYCFDLARKQRMVWGGRYGILMSDTYATPKASGILRQAFLQLIRGKVTYLATSSGSQPASTTRVVTRQRRWTMTTTPIDSRRNGQSNSSASVLGRNGTGGLPMPLNAKGRMTARGMGF